MSAAHLVVDVSSYTPGSVASMVPLAPSRLLETRTGPGFTTIDHQFEGIGVAAATTVVVLPVVGRGGVASDAGSVVLNVTVTEPSADGFITVFPCGQPRPNASSVNYTTGSTVANLVVSKVGDGGSVCLYTMSSTHLVVDVTGYVVAGTSALGSVVPGRVLESRVGAGYTTVDHLYEGTGKVFGGGVLDLPVTGRAGVPADAASVVVNVTVTDPAASGFVTVYPCDQPRPTASNLNYTAGTTVANAVISSVGQVGDICIYTMSTTHLIVDVNGYAV
jgi:hypothetical protein